MPINLKRKVYNECILPVTTYGLETTAINRANAEKLRVHQRAIERRMLGISLRDKIRNTEIRRRTKVSDVMEKISRLKWKWAGHIARMPEDRWTRRVVQWQPRQSQRNRGRPAYRWADDLVATAGGGWARTARDRMTWMRL